MPSIPLGGAPEIWGAVRLRGRPPGLTARIPIRGRRLRLTLAVHRAAAPLATGERPTTPQEPRPARFWASLLTLGRHRRRRAFDLRDRLGDRRPSHDAGRFAWDHRRARPD